MVFNPKAKESFWINDLELLSRSIHTSIEIIHNSGEGWQMKQGQACENMLRYIKNMETCYTYTFK